MHAVPDGTSRQHVIAVREKRQVTVIDPADSMSRGVGLSPDDATLAADSGALVLGLY